MKLISCHAKSGFATSYVLGPDGGGMATLIDPGFFGDGLFEPIERAGLEVRAVLLTRRHPAHLGGLDTVLRVYRHARVYAGGDAAIAPADTAVQDGETVQLGSLSFQVSALPGFAADAVAYRLGDLVFPGAALVAGGIGHTAAEAARTTLVNAIRTRILTLPDRVTILPGHGPPTTVRAERAFNPALR